MQQDGRWDLTADGTAIMNAVVKGAGYLSPNGVMITVFPSCSWGE